MAQGLDSLVQARIVDLTVQYGANPQISNGQGADSARFQIGHQRFVPGPIQILEANEQDVGLGRIGCQLHPVQIAQSVGQFATAAMILGESIDALIESDQAGGSDHSDLTHTPAEQFA